jgi:ABC-type amino acid transport substrate-binding protein
MLAMMKGDLDAVVCDDTYAQNLVTMNPGTHYVEAKLADGTITKEEYGVAVDKGNKTLVDAINATIQAMKDDGSMAKCIKDQIMKSTLKN